MNSMSIAQQRALRCLLTGVAYRPRQSFDWLILDQRFPLVVIARLRQRGYVRVKTLPDQLQASITESGKTALAQLPVGPTR